MKYIIGLIVVIANIIYACFAFRYAYKLVKDLKALKNSLIWIIFVILISVIFILGFIYTIYALLNLFY